MVRCPFCHDSIDADATQVPCASCGATHHAECFAEAGRCAPCSHPAVALRQGPVEAAALAQLLAEGAPVVPGQVARRTNPRQTVGRAVMSAGALLTLIGFLTSDLLLLTLVGLGMTLFVLGGILVGLSGAETIQVAHPGDLPQEFDPIFGTWTRAFTPGVPVDTTGGLEEALRAGADLPELPEEEPPEVCPDCAQPLETDGTPDAFCYHCGANRVTADGRWRAPGEPEEPGPEKAPRVST